MRDTHYHDDANHLIPRRADGYSPLAAEGRQGAGGFRLDMTSLEVVGDGGVFTTVEDLLLWDRNFYDNRLGGGGGLVEQLLTLGELESTDSESTDSDYAFGLHVGEYRGLPIRLTILSVYRSSKIDSFQAHSRWQKTGNDVRFGSEVVIHTNLAM